MREELEYISRVRVRNNDLWMTILDIALRKDPEATKAILAQIKQNDLLITQFEQEIIDSET